MQSQCKCGDISRTENGVPKIKFKKIEKKEKTFKIHFCSDIVFFYSFSLVVGILKLTS